MRILVTGAGGMLGHDVVDAAARAGHEAVALERADLDVTDEEAVRGAVGDAAPDVVVNCAAYTAVDQAEDEPEVAQGVNGAGAGNVAVAADSAGARVVYPSTDYVFRGTKREPYVESDETAPLSAYAHSKLAGERSTAAACARHHIVRTSWLFGARGANFVDTMLRLGGERDELHVVHDQVGCPTFTGHLAEALVRIAESDAFGVRHVAAAGEVSWHDFAVEIFRQAGLDCRVLGQTTEEAGRPAPRPAYSVLRSERDDAIELPHWREGLAGYLAERAPVR